jgi:hypothetical protein
MSIWSIRWLPQEKQVGLTALLNQFQTEKENLFSSPNGALTEKDRQQLKDLENQQRTRLAALLSPQELEDYDMRHSEASQYRLVPPKSP